MTFAVKITNPEDIPPGVAWSISKEEFDKITEQNEALVHIRGRVIASALTVEERLDEVLSTIFMGKELSKLTLFKELLLNKEFFTFINKWKVFRETTHRKIINFEVETARKDTLRLIKDVIETRDQFAHGHVVFSGTQPRLYFVKDGEERYHILDNDYFDVLNKIFGQASFVLEEILKFLRGESPQEVIDKKKV